MQEDLENLAKEMQKLKLEDKRDWLCNMAQCRERCFPTTCPTYKTWNQVREDFLNSKGILIRALSSILTSGKEKEIPVVKKGVDTFMSLTKEEREEFYTVVLKGIPCKVATKNSHSSSVTVNPRTYE